MMKLDYKQVISERLLRQGLTAPIESAEDEQQYLELFRTLQPVAPVHFTRPGDPPKLVHRTEFDDYQLSGRLREQHKLIKGRFCGGRIAYVLQEDLEQYAMVFRKPLVTHYQIHEDILGVIRNSGGLSKEQLKQELEDYPASEISKALQALHEAFLIYEDQPDTDWDTGWFEFSTEWFELRNDESVRAKATSDIVLRFIKTMVFATSANIKSWSSLTTKIVQQTIGALLEEGKIVLAEIDKLGQGYMVAEDASGLPKPGKLSSAFMLDKSDFLVRAQMEELKNRYKGHEVLQYLLIDGEFRGAVTGHWRIGPYDIDDIVLDDDLERAVERKEEILGAVRKMYTPEYHSILRYNGTLL